MDTLAGGTRWSYPGGPGAAPSADAEYLPLRDHLGSTVPLMTATRTGDLAQFYGAEPSAEEGFGLRIAESFDYDPYGWPAVHAPSGSPARFGDPVVGLLAIRSGQVGALEGTTTTAPLLSGRELWQWYTNTPGNDPMLTESETTRAPQSTVGWRHLYTGRPWEPQTRSYYYRHRWYDPHQARFLSRDPIGYGDGLLQYAYVGGDPISKVDPTGLEDKKRKEKIECMPTTRRRLPFEPNPNPAEYNIVLLPQNDDTMPCLDGIDDYYPQNEFQLFNLLKDMSGNLRPGSEIAIHGHGGSGYVSGTAATIKPTNFEKEKYDFRGLQLTFRVCNMGKGVTPEDLRPLWEALGGNGKGNKITLYTSAYYTAPFGIELGGISVTFDDKDFPEPPEVPKEETQ